MNLLFQTQLWDHGLASQIAVGTALEMLHTLDAER
jgi:hypothetical protein